MRGRGSRAPVTGRTAPAPRSRARGGARERRGPFKSRAQAGPGAAGAQSAARRRGVGIRRKSFLPTPAPRAAAAAHSSPGPAVGRAAAARAGARGQGQGHGWPGSFALAGSEQPPRPGPSGSRSGSSSSRSPATVPLRPPAPATWEVALPAAAPFLARRPPRGRLRRAQGRRREPRALRGRRGGVLRGCGPARAGRTPRVGAAPVGPDTCSAGSGVGAGGQDESDRVLRQNRHRGALQGGAAARPGAHAAGTAEVPEDPGEGERWGGEGGRGCGPGYPRAPRGRGTCQVPQGPVATLRGHSAQETLFDATCARNFCLLLI